jgi:spermidine/putrescine transport system ATP-binding protein
LSTRILVMSDGTVQQYGEPKKIYDEPVNRWVASFIGNANFFRGIKKDENLFEFYGTSITCDNQSINKKTKIGEEASFLIRPEDMNIVDSKNGIISAKITNITYKGILYNIIATWNEMNIEIETTEKHEVGEQVGLKWNVEDVHFFSDNYKGKE